MGWTRCSIGLCIALATAAAAVAEEPVTAPGAAAPIVASTHLRGSGQAGAVFFVPAREGAVAVGAAHSFDRTQLAESGEVEFRTGEALVASSTRFYTRPGRPYHKTGATLRDDFLVFVLSAAPQGVRILEPSDALPIPGDRVRIVGIPTRRDQRQSEVFGSGQSEIFGSVVSSDEKRIEVDLDAIVDLRGWGGAPVLEIDRDRVLGLLQSAWPNAGALRTGVGPIGGVIEALSDPLDSGVGRLFATLAPLPSAATGHAARRRVATGSPFGAQAPDESSARVIAAATRGSEPSPPPSSLPERTLRLEIEHPSPDAVVGDAAGVFLAGRALALRGTARRFDIMIVIDTSASTGAPTGVDVDGDGAVGEPLSNSARGQMESTDPGDSILAAEVAAAEKLVAGLDPRSTRVGLVTFAGEPLELAPGVPAPVRRAAFTVEPLTSDYRRLEPALARVREAGAQGMTHMAAGVDQATLELLGLEGSLSRADPESDKVVLFFTDGEPTLPHLGSDAGNVRSVLQSAQRARLSGVRIHSFAIGPEALDGPISTVEMAAITDGLFTPVRHPGRLVSFMDGVSFAHIEEVKVVNAGSGTRVSARVHADGSWEALVPLEEGANLLQVSARASDGAQISQSITVHHEPGASSPTVPVELLARHNQLLEDRLAALRFDRAEAMRRELVLEIERERVVALERAERQRKELEIEVERPD